MSRDLDYQKHLEELHAKQNVSEEILQSVVKNSTGKDLIARKKIIAGEANEVYNVELQSGVHVIARISRKERPDFMQERWAINKAGLVGVPVPEVLGVQHFTVNGSNLSVCILEKIPGDPLERGGLDYHDLNGGVLKRIIVKAGSVLSQIHSVPVEGFGEIDEAGKGEAKTFAELIGYKFEMYDHYFNLLSGALDKNNAKRAMELLSRLRGIPFDKPMLNHGDFGPKHIMTKDENITGIIDWGEVHGNSPIYDLANWDYWYGEDIPLSWLMEGYKNKKLFDSNFDEYLHLIRVGRGVDILNWYTSIKFERAVEKAKQKLKKDLDYFS